MRESERGRERGWERERACISEKREEEIGVEKERIWAAMGK